MGEKPTVPEINNGIYVITCLLEMMKIISVGQAQIYPQVIVFSRKASSDSICNCLLWREDYVHRGQC